LEIDVTGAMADAMRTVAMHVALFYPPPDVAFCLRAKDEDIVDRIVAADDVIQFDFSMQVKRTGMSDPPRFVGRFAFGPPAARFIYIGSGTFAGQANSCWSRRAKIGLTGITWEMIDQVAGGDARLEAHVIGRAGDGGPLCATIPLLNGGWRVGRPGFPGG
jgi:hypothetical protein